VNEYPAMIATVNHVEPVPRRIRAFLGGDKVLDTTRALYVWEWPYYPQYYIPLPDVRRDRLIPEGHTQQTGRGVAEPHGLRAGGIHRPHKGTTSGYWSVRIGDTVHQDLAWAYDFPTRQLLPIAGMVAFYNEKVDIFLDSRRLDRPQTHFFPADDNRKAGIAREATGRAEHR
jgi:uncharacterized protein (DUF427 family)